MSTPSTTLPRGMDRLVNALCGYLAYLTRTWCHPSDVNGLIKADHIKDKVRSTLDIDVKKRTGNASVVVAHEGAYGVKSCLLSRLCRSSSPSSCIQMDMPMLCYRGRLQAHRYTRGLQACSLVCRASMTPRRPSSRLRTPPLRTRLRISPSPQRM